MSEWERDHNTEFSNARTAAVLSISGLVMMASVCCTSVMGVMAGTLLGIIGIYMAYSQHHEDLTPEARAYNNVGLYTGGAATGIGCVYSLIIAMYILLYAVMIIMVIILEA